MTMATKEEFANQPLAQKHVWPKLFISYQVPSFSMIFLADTSPRGPVQSEFCLAFVSSSIQTERAARSDKAPGRGSQQVLPGFLTRFRPKR